MCYHIMRSKGRFILNASLRRGIMGKCGTLSRAKVQSSNKQTTHFVSIQCYALDECCIHRNGLMRCYDVFSVDLIKLRLI